MGHHQLSDKALIGCFALSGCLFMVTFYVLICRGSTHELSPTTATTKPCQCVWSLASWGIRTRRSGLSTWQKVVCVPPTVSHHCAGQDRPNLCVRNAFNEAVRFFKADHSIDLHV